MDPLEELRIRLTRLLPDARLELVPNGAIPAQASLCVDPAHAPALARLLRDEADLQWDFCSNVTGVDWPGRDERIKVRKVVGGVETEVEEIRHHPGFLEVVYHLYSVARKTGPLILRQRTADRGTGAVVSSLTPVWRSCEFQEREVFDLFGVQFTGHPDLRRILMWEGFQDHPMRKDYVAPEDYEYEPTPHGQVLERARAQSAGRTSAE